MNTEVLDKLNTARKYAESPTLSERSQRRLAELIREVTQLLKEGK